MGADFYATVVYGKVIEHEEYKDVEDCCEESLIQFDSGNFCKGCGKRIDTIEKIYLDDLYPDYDYYEISKNRFLVGKELHSINAEGGNPPEELKFLSTEKTDKIKADLGDGCKYFIHQYVSI